jgi:hypothetical protein
MIAPNDLGMAKQNLTIEKAWVMLGLPGNPLRGLNRSPFRQDQNPSFSIYGGGRRWKDFGTGEGGSVVDFVVMATGLPLADAIRKTCELAGVHQIIPPMPPSAFVPEPQPDPKPENRWENVKEEWREGQEYLEQNPKIRTRLAEWRGWPVAWVDYLLGHGYLSAPRDPENKTQRGIAFIVEEWEWEEASFSTPNCGFHYRKKSGDWRFYPKGIQATPFIIGNLCSPRLIVCEGQWDAITFAGSAGFLDGDPNHKESPLCEIAVVGIRGSSGYGSFLEHLAKRNTFLKQKPEVFLFRDADKAGETWRDKFAPRLAELATVRLFRPAAGKDLNDIHKADPLTLDEIRQTVGGIK